MTDLSRHNLGNASSRPRWGFPAVMAAVGVAAATVVDLPAANWAVQPVIGDAQLPTFLRKIIDLSEVFAYGGTVPVLLLVVAVLDCQRWRRVWRLAAASLGSGILASGCKVFVERTRPRAFHDPDIWASFTGWLPGFTRDSNGHSFPSAHTATAVGLAVGLTWMYPRGKWLFATFAVLAATQRVIVRAHFISDTCWGAALGFAFATLVIHTPLGRGFDRLEAAGGTAGLSRSGKLTPRSTAGQASSATP